MLKIGIIGSGFGLYGLLPAFHSLDNCKVVSICGEKTDRLMNYCNSIGLKNIYTDWKLMLNNENLDAVAIAVMPGMQFEIAKAAIKKGINVFTEKPLAINLPQAEKLLNLAEEYKITHAIDFIFPEIEEFKKVKEFIDNKTYGELKNISVEWDFLSYDIKNKISSWKTDATQGGGALSFYFSHVLYYLEYFVGRMTLRASHLSFAKESLRGGEVSVDILFESNNGASGHAHLNSNAVGVNKHQLVFIFEKATVILENLNSVTEFRIIIYTDKKEEKVHVSKKHSSLPNEDERVKVVRSLASRFVDACKGKKQMVPSMAGGVRVQYLIDKIRESSL